MILSSFPISRIRLRRRVLPLRIFVLCVLLLLCCANLSLIHSVKAVEVGSDNQNKIDDSNVDKIVASDEDHNVQVEQAEDPQTNDDDDDDDDDDDHGDDYDDEEDEPPPPPSPPPRTEHERMATVLGDFTHIPPSNLYDESSMLSSSYDADAQRQQVADWYLDQLLETSSLRHRLAEIFEKAISLECRQKVVTHLGYFMAALGKEEDMPFRRTRFNNTCPETVYEDWNNLPNDMHIGMIQNRTYQPPRNEAVYIGNPDDLRLLYAVLTHNDGPGTIRLIESLYEPGQLFVIHVDAKETSSETYQQLVDYASAHPDHVFLVPDPFRVRITWGGFSMVNATLQVLQYAFGLLHNEKNEPILAQSLDFHKVVHLASTSYPLASNTEIRHRLASFPLDANFLHVIMKPNRPSLWNYFVECDDAVHRIHHMPVLTAATSGANLFTSSQWWIISREFAFYLARAEEGTFVNQFLDYVEHVVVADETFFGTVLRHTEFCLKHHNRNFLHLQFDRWESDLPQDQRDEQKCMMKDPNHCGRSPTTMTVDYADILELSDDLFARKFVDSRDSQVKDIVDAWRAKRESSMQAYLADSSQERPPRSLGMEFEGHGVLIVAKETGNDITPLCMALGESGNEIQLVPCFYEGVVPNLLENWETGAVIQGECLRHNRWEMSPCTTDGALERDDSTAGLKVTPGNYSVTGPRCMLKQMDGVRAGRCFDGDTGDVYPGGETLVFPCVHRWGQFLSVGDGSVAPLGSLFFHIPAHIIQKLSRAGREQHAYMCLSVGELEEDEEESLHPIEFKSSRPMSEWMNHQIISIPCHDTENIIEWVFVPYIVDDDNTDAAATDEVGTVDRAGQAGDGSPISACISPDCPEKATKL